MVEPLANAHPVGMEPSFAPETELERRLLNEPRLQAGLSWGRPRAGHPEGRVADHVMAMLAAIAADDPLRRDLRFLALTHDSFKAQIRPDRPWSPENDHAAIARRFAEGYTGDERLLTTLELHDEPYWIWRTADAPEHALRRLLERLPDPDLFARFVELDATSEGKDLTFLWWFRRELAIVRQLPTHPAPPTAGESDDVIYVKAFATTPEQQLSVARAANELIHQQQASMQADGEVLTSDDGLRVLLIWRWHRSRSELIERDEQIVREALAAHQIFEQARPSEARIFRLMRTG